MKHQTETEDQKNAKRNNISSINSNMHTHTNNMAHNRNYQNKDDGKMEDGKEKEP